MPRDEGGGAVAVVDIDEASLKRFGQWPWPRRRMAQLLHVIATGRPAAIGFNIVFSEPDRMSSGSII